jgi:hypothetical protein
VGVLLNQLETNSRQEEKTWDYAKGMIYEYDKWY